MVEAEQADFIVHRSRSLVRTPQPIAAQLSQMQASSVLASLWLEASSAVNMLELQQQDLDGYRERMEARQTRRLQEVRLRALHRYYGNITLGPIMVGTLRVWCVTAFDGELVAFGTTAAEAIANASRSWP